MTLRQVARLPLIGVRRPGPAGRAGAAPAADRHEPDIVFRSNDNPTVQGFVAAGLGYALMPRLTVDEDDPEVAVVPTVDRVPPRQLGVIWHVDRQLPPSVHRFVELAVEVCAGSADAGWPRAAGSGASGPRSSRPVRSGTTSASRPSVRPPRGARAGCPRGRRAGSRATAGGPPPRARRASGAAPGVPASGVACGARAGRGGAGGGSSSPGTGAPRPRRAAARARGPGRPARPRRCRCRRRPVASPRSNRRVPTRPSREMS